MSSENPSERTLEHVRTSSRPSELRITDLRVATITAPMRCPLLKIYTNQGLVGFGEVRDGASKDYALMLKSRLLGENPCDVDRLFRKAAGHPLGDVAIRTTRRVAHHYHPVAQHAEADDPGLPVVSS